MSNDALLNLEPFLKTPRLHLGLPNRRRLENGVGLVMLLAAVAGLGIRGEGMAARRLAFDISR